MTNTYQTRADQLHENRVQLERLSDILTAIATDANRRKDHTTQNHALDGIEQLTELARNLAAQMRQLRDELHTHTRKAQPQ